MKNSNDIKEKGKVYIVYEDKLIETAYGHWTKVPYIKHIFLTEDEAIDCVEYHDKLGDKYYYEEYKLETIKEEI
ncbi:MAG: hypothetical protein WC262_11285 [Bacteroidales bacterium]|jgi:hypothetical protein